MRSTFSMRTAKIGYIISSCLFCAFGLILIFFPEISISLIGTLIGCAMILFGVFKIIGYFSKDLFRLAFQYDLAFGILLGVLGTIILMRPEMMMNFLCVALGIAILADGLFKVQIAVDSKTFGIGRWWLIMVAALLTGCIGLALIFRPADAALAITAMLGIALLLDGIMSLITVMTTVKIIRNQQPDVVEVKYREIM
ncbi:MAG: DUF308 domain-containing protein [Lachnospiraceae bacterium]|nr:DUF308 domain-containing protein [Lachnospiraceae bacterium]